MLVKWLVYYADVEGAGKEAGLLHRRGGCWLGGWFITQTWRVLVRRLVSHYSVVVASHYSVVVASHYSVVVDSHYSVVVDSHSMH